MVNNHLSSCFRSTFVFLATVLLMAILFQGTRGLMEPDEGRYAESAREMLNTGHWIVPQLNDKPHITKPPLTYWCIMAGMSLLGENEWGARIFSAFAFAATAFLIRSLATKIWDKPTGILSGWIYLTALLPFFAGNILTTDTFLTFWETLAVWAYWNAFSANTPIKASRSSYWMWAAFGFAFLTKGPPSLLPLLAIFIHCRMKSSFDWQFKSICNPAGILLGSLTGLSWHIGLCLTNPDLIHYFLRDELFGRVFTGMHHRNDAWYGFLIVYIPSIFIGFIPWIFIWPLFALKSGTFHDKAVFLQQKIQNERGFFVVLWFLLPLLFFCIARSRLPLYVLPLFAPLTLATARLITCPFQPSPSILENKTACLKRTFSSSVWQWGLILWCIILVSAKYEAAFWPKFTKSNWDARMVYQDLQKHLQGEKQRIVALIPSPIHGLEFYMKHTITYFLQTDNIKQVLEPTISDLSPNNKQSPLQRQVILLCDIDLNRIKDKLTNEKIPYEIIPLPFGFKGIEIFQNDKLKISGISK